MGFFKNNRQDPVDPDAPLPVEPTPGRPAGMVGDTGLKFSGWYNISQTTLQHAGRDDDPRCQRVLCLEARQACDLARITAVNGRQREMARFLQDAIDSVARVAATTPALGTPHTHDVAGELFT